MSRVLIHIARANSNFEVGLGFNRYTIRSFPTKEVTAHSFTEEDACFYEVDEREIEGALEFFTSLHPGRTVSIYRLEATALRPAQEKMLRSQVTKEGVLPK